jgi:hypothetical protein
VAWGRPEWAGPQLIEQSCSTVDGSGAILDCRTLIVG